MMFRIGRGTGHFDVDSATAVSAAAPAPTAATTSLAEALRSPLSSFSLANTCRKLRLRASAEGHDLESNILRTARLLALLRDLVRDRTRRPDASAVAAVATVVISAASASVVVPLLLLLVAPYDRESDTSDGAMQKSISLTLPLLWKGMLPSAAAADVVDSSSAAVGWA